MTHSGGKPHAVGDRGQRYEVSYFDPDDNVRKTFGWSNSPEGARSMAEAIELHPSMQFPQIRDRHQSPTQEIPHSDAGGSPGDSARRENRSDRE